MSQIKEYTQQDSGPGAVRQKEYSGQDFGGDVGNALIGLGGAVEGSSHVVYKRAEQSEISNLHAKISQAHADFTTNFQEALRDPKSLDNPNLVTDMLKHYDDQMGKLQDDITTHGGKDYFLEANSKLRAHVVETAVAGQSELAGLKDRANFQTAQDNFSFSVNKDPSSFQIALKLQDQAIGQLKHLPAPEAAKLKQASKLNLAESAFRGWIRLNPEVAEQKLKSGEFSDYFNSDKMEVMEGEIHKAKNAIRVEQERAEKAAKEKDEQEQQDTMSNYLGRIYGDEKLKNPLTPQEIIDSNLSAERQHTYIKMIEASGKEDFNKTDPKTFRDLYSRIILPDGDKNKLFDEKALDEATIQGKLSIEHNKYLKQEIKDRSTQEGRDRASLRDNLFKYAENTLVKKNGFGVIQNPRGVEQLMRFQSFAYEQEAKAKKEGIPLSNLYTPGKPEYIGGFVQNYLTPFPEVMEDRMNSIKRQQEEYQKKKNPGLKPEDIEKLDLDGLNKLDKKTLSPEATKAARDRYNKLAGQGK